jgi:hypothetical protein
MTELDSGDIPEPNFELKTLDEACEKYGLDPVDEFVGSPASRIVIDFGRPPVILANSSRTPSSRDIQRKILGESPPRGFRRLWERIWYSSGSG